MGVETYHYHVKQHNEHASVSKLNAIQEDPRDTWADKGAESKCASPQATD